MKKRAKRICVFFLALLLIMTTVQPGLIESDASSTSAVTETEQSDTAADSSQSTAAGSQHRILLRRRIRAQVPIKVHPLPLPTIRIPQV